MLSQHKRAPAYTDTDLMPFGKYIKIPLSDIPANYLKWLYHELRRDNVHKLNADIPKVRLFNYIWNSQDAIADELGESFP